MPRKVQSSGESTQQKNTSLKRALKPKAGGHSKKSGDGGPWAGSGAKTVEHSEGPSIARKEDRNRPRCENPECDAQRQSEPP